MVHQSQLADASAPFWRLHFQAFAVLSDILARVGLLDTRQTNCCRMIRHWRESSRMCKVYLSNYMGNFMDQTQVQVNAKIPKGRGEGCVFEESMQNCVDFGEKVHLVLVPLDMMSKYTETWVRNQTKKLQGARHRQAPAGRPAPTLIRYREGLRKGHISLRKGRI